MFFPILGVHINGAEFQYPDLIWKESLGIMANLVGKTRAREGENWGKCLELRQQILANACARGEHECAQKVLDEVKKLWKSLFY